MNKLGFNSELSTEQQFHLRAFEIEIKQMSLEQTREMLGKLYRTMLHQENGYKELLAKEWNLPRI